MNDRPSRTKIPPVPHNPALDDYIGMWVAVKDGAVVMAARTSVELASKMRGKNIRGVVTQYVPVPSDAWKVGPG